MKVLFNDASWFAVPARSRMRELRRGGVAVVRSPGLSPSEVGRWLADVAEPVGHPYFDRMPGHPGTILIEGAEHRAGIWHYDESFLPKAPDLTVLHMDVQADIGGETEWIDLGEAWEGIPQSWKDGLVSAEAEVVHMPPSGEQSDTRSLVVWADAPRLDLNRLYSTEIRSTVPGLSLPCTLAELLEHTEATPSADVLLDPGDIAMWFNRLSIHRSRSYSSYRRVLRQSFNLEC